MRGHGTAPGSEASTAAVQSASTPGEYPAPPLVAHVSICDHRSAYEGEPRYRRNDPFGVIRALVAADVQRDESPLL
jgi:hypothetical protein